MLIQTDAPLQTDHMHERASDFVVVSTLTSSLPQPRPPVALRDRAVREVEPLDGGEEHRHNDDVKAL